MAPVGGRGNPARAPEAEQDERAAMLYEQRGHAALAGLRPRALGAQARALGRQVAMMSRIEMMPWTSPPLTTTR